MKKFILIFSIFWISCKKQDIIQQQQQPESIRRLTPISNDIEFCTFGFTPEQFKAAQSRQRHSRYAEEKDYQLKGKPQFPGDRDEDGIKNGKDNCPWTYNPDQLDTDNDGVGDACEDAPPPPDTDLDDDGIDDSVDDCPTEPENYNGYQDTDGCPDVPPFSYDNVLYLDFDGETINGTAWNLFFNSNETLILSPANLTEAEQIDVTNRIAAHYAAFNTIVTRDRVIYDATPITNRNMTIYTENWQWIGGYGGISYVDVWGEGDFYGINFVFTVNLSYSPKYISDAGTHEDGHTVSLNHIGDWSADGTTLLNQYSYGGCGTIFGCDNGPNMGAAYYVANGLWVNTKNVFGIIQDDVTLIGNRLGFR